jgi:hypothetical protein
MAQHAKAQTKYIRLKPFDKLADRVGLALQTPLHQYAIIDQGMLAMVCTCRSGERFHSLRNSLLIVRPLSVPSYPESEIDASHRKNAAMPESGFDRRRHSN